MHFKVTMKTPQIPIKSGENTATAPLVICDPSFISRGVDNVRRCMHLQIFSASLYAEVCMQSGADALAYVVHFMLPVAMFVIDVNSDS